MNPSDDDIGRMQQEAVRRVRDMQQRAKNMSASRASRQSQPAHQAEPPEQITEPEPESPEAKLPNPISSEKKPTDILDGFFKDKEKSLILLLLVLLSGEEDNSGIMLALLYLLI